MHRSRWAACACAVALTILPMGADAAGVYENAATESALLVSPSHITARATIEIGAGHDLHATMFRIVGAFPARKWFLLWVEMPFVAVSGDAGSESGPGDLLLRGRARLWGSDGRALAVLGKVGTGTGSTRFFPYSSQTLDINLSVGFVDSIGAVQPFVVAGYEWAHRVDEPSYSDDTMPADHLRVTGGADIDLGRRSDIRGGVAQYWYNTSAQRTLAFAGTGFDWRPALRLLAEGQVELGDESQRVGDWSITAGLAVRF